MNIQEAIKIAKDKEKTESLMKAKEKSFNVKITPINEEGLKKKRKQELLNNLIEKSSRIDNEIKEGIKFIESKNKHFTLDKEFKTALYLYPDGNLYVQTWGMYIGDNNIHKLSKNMCDYFDLETLQFLMDVDFKALLIKQITGVKND